MDNKIEQRKQYYLDHKNIRLNYQKLYAIRNSTKVADYQHKYYLKRREAKANREKILINKIIEERRLKNLEIQKREKTMEIVNVSNLRDSFPLGVLIDLN
jgi:hypothetical protein